MFFKTHPLMMTFRLIKYPILFLGLMFFVQTAQAQLGQDSTRNVITTAVPFLGISPDARAAGMGDVGVATSPDANASYWNVSKLAFTKQDWGLAVSFTPWLQKLVDDMSISYLSFYKHVSKRQTVGVSLRYFDMGQLQFTDNNGQILQDFNPRELALSGSFAMKLSEKLSIGGTARFIHSNLSGNVAGGSIVNAKPGNTASVDLATYYKTKLNFNSMDANLSLGAVISNIGPRITYSNPTEKDFLPMNLRLGAAFDAQFDEYNKIVFALDFNKYLVPTPPIRDASGNIISGKDDDRNLIPAILGSFGDAPDGFSEELKEVILSVGVEYWYNNIFALRGGYFSEAEDKGDRKYFTLGLGIRYQAFGLDFAYVIPKKQNHPLSDTLRFSLLFNIGKDAPNDMEIITDEAK